jgi:hypothetical protein
MGDGFWSTGCRADVEYYGYPGQGAYYRTARFGQHWVGGGVYGKFAEGGRFECNVQPFLGAPVKDYGWVQEMNNGRGCYGQWFENGAIGYHDGAWRIMYGNYGQTAGRLAPEPSAPDDAELPPEAEVPVEPQDHG